MEEKNQTFIRCVLSAFSHILLIDVGTIGVEGFKLAPKQDSSMRNDQGKNHILVK